MQTDGADLLKGHEALCLEVVQMLRAHRNPNDIIMQVCQETGCDWQQGQRFVEQVETEFRPQLAGYRLRLYLAVGLVISGVGSILLVFAILTALGYPPMLDAVATFSMYVFPISPLRMVLVGGGLGFLMASGGLIGSHQAVSQYNE